MRSDKDSFASLFKKYRLRSEIETLSQFGDLLAQEGLVYESSLFTHWQKGDRVPKDRKVALAIIKIFARRKGIQSLDEANLLLDSVQMRDLSNLEEIELSKGATVFIGDRTATAKLKENPAKIVYYAIAKLTASRFVVWVTLLFFVQNIWFLRVSLLQLQDSYEAYILCWFYGFNAFSGAIFAFRQAVKKKNSDEGKILKFLALGLSGQCLGLQIWTIYNVTGTVVPYPSIADLSYFTGILCYCIAALYILNRYAYRSISSISKKKIMLFLVPVIAFVSFYSFFLQTFGFSILRQVTIGLNLAYPLINAVPIMLITYILVFSAGVIDRATKLKYMGLIVAFSFQFLADYFFVYTVQMKEFVNGGLADYFYATSYAVMCIAITNYSLLLNYSTIKYPKWLLILIRMWNKYSRSSQANLQQVPGI